jgi:uncharacterized protein
VAVVEVARAAKVANPGRESAERAELVLGWCTLIALDGALLGHAARLADHRLGTLGAIHLASALRVEPDELVAYDRRLLEAAEAVGLHAVSPGATV